MIVQASTPQRPKVQVPFKTGAYFDWTPRPAEEALSHGHPYPGSMTDKDFTEFLKIQQNMNVKLKFQFRQTNIQAILNGSSTLSSHMVSFAQVIADCQRSAPAGLFYVAAAIPTIPPP